MKELLSFEISREGASSDSLPESGVPKSEIPKGLRRVQTARLPELSELEVVRHFTRLSQWNFSIDTNFYPLGSCTMKYNPRINEEAARYPGLSNIHPYQPEEDMQGALALMFRLEQYLAEIAGMDAVTLQPAAGAHGELVGVLLMRAYLKAQGNPRKKILVPDSAHGTNPATCSMAEYDVIQVRSEKNGCVSKEKIQSLMTEDVAGLMITNPNTLGLFERDIKEICDIVHAKGGLVYGDGANMNALLGKARPGDLGIDIIHYNLHKTFTTPHGGGGPGAGPVAVKKHLAPFLPIPRIVESQRNGKSYYSFQTDCPQSIGRVKAFYGNFGMFVRAYTYIREMGPQGLKQVAEMAILNANYIKAQLTGHYHLPYGDGTLHEAVFSDKKQKAKDISALDIAKRLIDYGFHPPTMYFPLVVFGALMIEPTETESKQTLDEFCDAMKKIAEESETNPDIVHHAPHNTHVKRLDEARAARNLKLRHQFN